MTTIDCDTCPVRGRHCGDCFVPLLVGGPDAGRPVGVPDPVAPPRSAPQLLALDRAERAAVGAFVRAGLLAPAAADRVRARPTGSGLSAVG
jgi:hypothetical protein